MHKLLKRRAAGQSPEEPKAPSASVMEFADRHREDVFQSDREAPERFSDLRTLDGHGGVDPGDFLVPAMFSGSLLDKDAVRLGNNRIFLKRYGDQPGVSPLSGEQGSYGVAIRVSSISESMLDDLKVLSDYPNDDENENDISDHEQVDEAWNDWVRYEFIRALERRFPEAEIAIDMLDGDQTRSLFDSVRKRVGLEWTHNDTGVSIDVEKITQDCTEGDLYDVTDEVAEENPEED